MRSGQEISVKNLGIMESDRSRSLDHGVAPRCKKNPLQYFRWLATAVRIIIALSRYAQRKTFCAGGHGQLSVFERKQTEMAIERWRNSAVVMKVQTKMRLKMYLSKSNEERSDTEKEEIFQILKGMSSLQQYPTELQRVLAGILRYESFGAQRVILKQGHKPSAAYFIIAGSALVNITEVNWKDNTQFNQVTSVLFPGDAFGERALVHGGTRQATVISREPIELLVAEKTEFSSVLEKSYIMKAEEVISYCCQLDVMKEWPLENLLSQPNKMFFRYYRSGNAIIADNNNSAWIAIVKSGKCRIETDVAVPCLKSGQIQLHSWLPKIPKTQYLVAYNANSEKTCRKLTVQIRTLKNGEYFGLSTMFHKTTFSYRLVSQNSECVLISKAFLIKEGPKQFLYWLRQKTRFIVEQEEEMITESVFKLLRWKQYKKQLLQETVLKKVKRK